MSAQGGEPRGDPSDPGFWLERWEQGRTPFHKAGVQPWLVEHFERLAPRGGERVLVPLCGKSVDMPWLEARGCAVVGVELAEKALRDFLREQGRAFEERSAPPFRVFRAGGIELWQGDFFALDPRAHGTFGAILDRAALIAIPAPRRAAYARRLAGLCAPRGRILLIGLEFDRSRMEGPPFCVARDELPALFGGDFRIERLGERPILDEEPHFKERGLDWLLEYAALLEKRG